MEQFKSFLSEISETQWSLLNKYCELLLDWNTKINLISRKDTVSLKEKHVLPILAAISLRYFHKFNSLYWTPSIKKLPRSRLW